MRRAKALAYASFPVITIQEAGLDGFWVHCILEQAGIKGPVAKFIRARFVRE
jgi:transposase